MAETQATIEYPVYLGVWTNWSLGGRIRGSTVTLNHHNGALLTAFLAVFVTFAGSRLWRIICFVLHQLLHSEQGVSQDGLYHQRQAILRNASDEKTGFLNLIRTLIAWRHRAHRPFSRMIPIIGFSLFISTVFPLGSIFSSRISSSMGNEVLVSSPNCGMGISNSSVNPTIKQYDEIFRPWQAERMTSYANYAQRCYSESLEAESSEADSAQRDSCTPFVKRKISSIVDRNASCPFEEEICRNRNGNIKIDTGYIDSQADLGLNLPADLRFAFRKILQCAPLESKGYQKIANYSQDKPYMQYFYGSQAGTLLPSNTTLRSFTFQAEQQSAEELAWRRFDAPLADYTVASQCCFVYNGSYDNDSTSFVPIKELAQTDGDVVLIFLSANGIRYSESVDDEWYSAHQGTNDTFAMTSYNSSAPYYLSDEPASPLGCKEQYQMCDPALPSERGCSPLGGLYTISFDFNTPRTKREWAIYWGTWLYNLQDLIDGLRSSSLTARFSLSQGIQAPLPVGQWQREVENWHNIISAAYQGAAIDGAVGPGNSDILKYFWTKPTNSVERYICKNQKMISTAYTNFSAMWLVIVLIIGTSILILEQSMETIVVWLERHNIIRMSTTEWFGNDTLQLQRMAHEELGLGDWEGCKGKAIPITRKGQLLGVFSTADPDHPKLVNPHTITEKPESVINIDGPSDEGAAVDESGTEVNNAPHSLSQDNDNESVDHNGNCNSPSASPDEGPDANDHNSTDHPSIENPDNTGRPGSLTAALLEGGAASSPNASPAQLEAIPVPHSLDIDTRSEA